MEEIDVNNLTQATHVYRYATGPNASSHQETADAFGISRRLVTDIVDGTRWPEVRAAELSPNFSGAWVAKLDGRDTYFAGLDEHGLPTYTEKPAEMRRYMSQTQANSYVADLNRDFGPGKGYGAQHRFGNKHFTVEQLS
jgi:hypothetical protein